MYIPYQKWGSVFSGRPHDLPELDRRYPSEAAFTTPRRKDNVDRQAFQRIISVAGDGDAEPAGARFGRVDIPFSPAPRSRISPFAGSGVAIRGEADAAGDAGTSVGASMVPSRPAGAHPASRPTAAATVNAAQTMFFIWVTSIPI